MSMSTTAAPSCRERWAERAYNAIAPVYDDFTAHHNYELWLGNLLPKLEAHCLRGKRLLDVGCGTGKSFLPMLARDWQVTACDISAEMVSRAASKAGGQARLSVADMRQLPRFGEFDLVWALDDAVNYLLSQEELERALAGMARNLAPTGLLLFDVNTLQCYRTFFAETEMVESGGRRLIWRGQASADVPPRSICESLFEAEELEPAKSRHSSASWRGGSRSGITTSRPEPVATHLHRQRHFPEEDVRTALANAGLECLDVFGHGYDAIPHQPLDELDHTKAVYIAGPARRGSPAA